MARQMALDLDSRPAYMTRLFLTAEEAAEAWNARSNGGDDR